MIFNMSSHLVFGRRAKHSCSLINVLAVKAYGEAESWLSGGKVILIFALFSFVFVTMVCGNPQGDAYGFRYYDNPGAFLQYLSTDGRGRFQGFLAALWSAAFTAVGPENISIVARGSKKAENRHQGRI